MLPPKGSGRASYLSAVTNMDDELIDILDVEKIFNEILPVKTDLSKDASNVKINDKKEKLSLSWMIPPLLESLILGRFSAKITFNTY
jgi:hypothetical protein